MDRQNNQKVKLRLRLKTGEEFEAEGSLDFVLQQKEEFLNTHLKIPTQTPRVREYLPTQKQEENTYLRSKQPSINTPQIYINATQNKPPEERYSYTPSGDMPQIYNTILTDREVAQRIGKYQPSYIQHNRDNKVNIEETLPADGIRLADGIRPADGIRMVDAGLWSKVAYIDGGDIILRRKNKLLKPSLAGLIVLASAKMLAGITKMSALELSKSLKLSGYLKPTERLDRILSSEIKAGSLFYEGTKRKRDYIISQVGIAKAYTAAENFLIPK